ncbi:MAG: hypothetical protein V1775_16690 [Bacteroidota bacterium]
MKRNSLLLIFVSLLAVSLLIIVFIGLRYCSDGLLSFNSSEFNNIATPIISFLGVIGLIVTILISHKQIAYSRSEQYFKDFQFRFEKISKEQNAELMFPNIQLIKFFDYVDKTYFTLCKEFPDYLKDVEKFRKDEFIVNIDKPYDGMLGNIRLFRLQSIILYVELLNLVKEIEYHKQLVSHHKDLLLDNLISGLISEYLSSCRLINEEYSVVIDTFYIGFHQGNFKREDLKFFNNDFFKLRDYIISKNEFERYIK